MRLLSLSEASIQPRTSPLKFAEMRGITASRERAADRQHGGDAVRRYLLQWDQSPDFRVDSSAGGGIAVIATSAAESASERKTVRPPVTKRAIGRKRKGIAIGNVARQS